MKIEGDTIIFKSTPPFYQKEQKGLKPNTVRILSQSEEEQLDKAKNQLKTIRIISTETGDSFERGITDISLTILEAGKRVVFVFSWYHFHFYKKLERWGDVSEITNHAREKRVKRTFYPEGETKQ